MMKHSITPFKRAQAASMNDLKDEEFTKLVFAVSFCSIS